jgi:molybdenum cofactor biosynthesis protein B
MPRSVDEHRAASPARVRCAVITVSDTRTLQTDRGGALVVEMLEAAGHSVARREIIPDEPDRMRPLVRELVGDAAVEAVLLTGGTGIGQRDQTFETISEMLTKPMPGYGELFRMLSFEDIGPAAMLSRAVGGAIDGKVVLTMPGSTAAVRLAMERLIIPEIAHLVHEARK